MRNNIFCWVSNYNDAADYNKFYYSRLTTTQREELSIVMIQHLLRENGSCVKIFFPTLIDLSENTARKCGEEGLHKEAVDIRLSITIIVINI